MTAALKHQGPQLLQGGFWNCAQRPHQVSTGTASMIMPQGLRQRAGKVMTSLNRGANRVSGRERDSPQFVWKQWVHMGTGNRDSCLSGQDLPICYATSTHFGLPGCCIGWVGSGWDLLTRVQWGPQAGAWPGDGMCPAWVLRARSRKGGVGSGPLCSLVIGSLPRGKGGAEEGRRSSRAGVLATRSKGGAASAQQRRFLWANMKLGPSQVIGYTIVFPRFCIPASEPMVSCW